MEYFNIKNWEKFQHYKDRCPPWIKLHATIFEDYEFDCLQDASKLHLLLIWVLASKLGEKNPRIPNDADWIRRKIHLKNKPDLKPLFEQGFLILDSSTLADSSKTLAPCYQDARTEGEGEGETEVEKRREEREKIESWFKEDWGSYPRKAGSVSKALECYLKSITSEEKRQAFHDKTRLYISNTDKAFLKHGLTWFRNWEDHEVAIHVEPETKTSKAMNLIKNFKSGVPNDNGRCVPNGNVNDGDLRLESGRGWTDADLEAFGK